MILLASQSASRRAMLEAAMVPFMALPARVDERAIEAKLGDAPPAEIALALAQAKALAVAALHPGRLVLGSDSLVVCGGRRFDKPGDRAEGACHDLDGDRDARPRFTGRLPLDGGTGEIEAGHDLHRSGWDRRQHE